MSAVLDRTADAEIAGKERGLVAGAAFARGEVILIDRPIAIGVDESDLLLNSYASAGARDVVDSLCSIDAAALDPEDAARLARTVEAAAATRAFFAPFGDDGGGDDGDTGGGGDGDAFEAWARFAAPRLECNVFTAWDASYEARGVGLYARASRLNHSCRPNLVRERRGGGGLAFTTLRPVAAGDELTFSYVPVTDDAAKRRSVLQTHFQFDCGCARCGADDDGGDPGALGHVGCGGSWNAADACAMCGAPRPPPPESPPPLERTSLGAA